MSETHADMQLEQVDRQEVQVDFSPPSDVLLDAKRMNALFKMAKFYSSSMIVPAAYQGSPENCFVACSIAARMGLEPVYVMQNLYVVQGKPSWSGQACMALIQGCGLFADVDFVSTGAAPGTDEYGCYVKAIRKRDGKAVKGTTITIGMAKAEGWYDKNGSKWKTMPEQMLKYRAAAFFARTECPNVLMGFRVEGEIEDAQGPENQGKRTITLDGGNNDAATA